LVGAQPKKWDENKKLVMQTRLNRLAKEMAEKLGAECVVMTAFWPAAENMDTMHMLTGGQSPYPLAVLFKYLQEMFDKTPEDPGDGPGPDTA
jgi:hypothetical protein